MSLNSVIDIDEYCRFNRTSIEQDNIQRGLCGGVTAWSKWGKRNTSTAASGDETLWAFTDNLTILTTSTTFAIAYNNTTDGLGTTGAISLLISYIDANYQLQSALHTLGSSGSDTTSFTGFGINRCVVLSSGSLNQNTNDISITATTGGSNQAIVPAGLGVTQQCVFHAPISSVGVIKYINASAGRLAGGNDPKVEFKLWSYNRFTETKYEIWADLLDTSVGTKSEYLDPVGLAISGRDVIYMTMDTDINSTIARGRFSLNLYTTA